MRAHTITTKPRVGHTGRGKRTIVPRGILAMSLAAALLVWMVVPGTASAHRTLLTAKMSGAQVVGQAGVPGVEGTAKLHLADLKGRQWKPPICFTIKYSAFADHGFHFGIYEGKRGHNGALRLPFGGPSANKAEASSTYGCKNFRCVTCRKLLSQMARHPRRFYVQVATDEHPHGAFRGQLKRGQPTAR